MRETLKIHHPYSGELVAERPLATSGDLDEVLDRATAASHVCRSLDVEERIAICERAIKKLEANKDELALELTRMMGRPIRYAPGEIVTCADRARTMMRLAESALSDIALDDKAGFTRFIRRRALGVVLVVPAWNFPYMIAVNAVVPAILSGNSVVLKHSEQTALVGERFSDAFEGDLVQSLHASHARVAEAIGDPRTHHVCFTGSVAGGHAVSHAAAGRFISVGLELGGKDPAYVREDADVDFAVENIVDGAFFNSGQSCCGVERVYVHRAHYDAFVEGAAKIASSYVLGDPESPETTLGPMAKSTGADAVRAHVSAALEAGARSLTSPLETEGQLLSPQVLVDVDHSMAVMREETFGPTVAVMSVDDDERAIELMNDSPYGLTASIWSRDEDAAVSIGDRVDTGTIFLNRCDYLDPELAWVGVKESGRGCTLSRVGFEQLTRPKSFHLRTKT